MIENNWPAFLLFLFIACMVIEITLEWFRGR